MSPGKIAAQAAHAETLAMTDYLTANAINPSEEGLQTDIELYSWLVGQQELFSKWYGDGHYTKYVMLAEDTEQLNTIETYLNAEPRNFKTYLVIDEGHTEGTYMVPTAMSVELVDKDDQRVTSIFSTFKIYKALPVVQYPTEPIKEYSRLAQVYQATLERFRSRK